MPARGSIGWSRNHLRKWLCANVGSVRRRSMPAACSSSHLNAGLAQCTVGQGGGGGRDRVQAEDLAQQQMAERARPVLVLLIEHFGLELGHVDLRRAFGLAGLALQAEVERFVKRFVIEAVFLAGQFAGHRQAEQVGATAGRVDFVARDHVAGAHRAARPSCGRHRRPSTSRPPGQTPPDSEKSSTVGCGLVRMVVRPDAQVLAGVGVAHDLAGVEPVLGVKGAFDVLKGRVNLGPEQLAVPEAAGQSVAVLAAHRAAEFDHQVGDLARDRPQACPRPRAS